MQKKPLVIYHANCWDGFAAAWCFWTCDPHGYEFHPGVYGEEPPDVSDRQVYLVDFSYKRDVVRDMAYTADSITIIDHHKSAIEDLVGLDEDVSNVFLALDDRQSGCVLAWRYKAAAPVPELLAHIEDRDLWRFWRRDTRAICAALFSHEYDFELFQELVRDCSLAESRLEMVREGEALLRQQDRNVRSLLATLRTRMTIAGHDVPVANLPHVFASDAGHLMCKGEPFAATWYETATHRVFSLRSAAEGGLDVSKIAAVYGGGGHFHAAGFRVTHTVGFRMTVAALAKTDSCGEVDA